LSKFLIRFLGANDQTKKTFEIEVYIDSGDFFPVLRFLLWTTVCDGHLQMAISD
jgi:hypothetical protein